MRKKCLSKWSQWQQVRATATQVYPFPQDPRHTLAAHRLHFKHLFIREPQVQASSFLALGLGLRLPPWAPDALAGSPPLLPGIPSRS